MEREERSTKQRCSQGSGSLSSLSTQNEKLRHGDGDGDGEGGGEAVSMEIGYRSVPEPLAFGRFGCSS